ncbi:hypothetical protein ACROYT_G013242 [Oculina patagonica]
MSEVHLNPFDITLVVENGKEFRAHRNVLSHVSPFFEKLLSTDMKENNEGVIRLEWITESQMADILQFIYSGNVQITTQEKAYSVAERFSCEELTASTRKFINSTFITVASSNDFLNLPSHEVEKWISSDEIVIDAEENVFEILLRWINYDKSERSAKFCELFRHVRLTTISRDILLNDIVTNELVKENEPCFDNVTAALNWIDRSTGRNISRPHSPRKTLETSVIVTAVSKYFLHHIYTCFYLPATDKWYRLPATIGQPVRNVVSYRGNVFVVTEDIAGSQCYDPDWNYWSPAPWAKSSNLPLTTDFGTLGNTLSGVVVVKDQIHFLVEDEEFGPTNLWTYNFNSNSSTSLFNWVDAPRVGFCTVVVDSFIYVIGGIISCYSSHEDANDDMYPGAPLSESSRFNTETKVWQKIAPLNEARGGAFGVRKNEKIFITGGCRATCEVYHMRTDEWHLIASLTFLTRTMPSEMVHVDETLYVLGGRSTIIKCYDHERDVWNFKADVDVKKMTMPHETESFARYSFFKCCSLLVFKGILENLESIDMC